MSVRKIPKNHLCVTGSFASRKNGQMGGFESLLEKEYMLLLDFDEDVAGFEEQPVTIPLPGVAKGYTPDVLVFFRADHTTGLVRAPLLTEVKHSDDLKKNVEKYAPKFAAAQQYAAERGWKFQLTTEQEIRTPRLANLKFLREYRNIKPTDDDCNRIIGSVRDQGACISVCRLLDHLGTDEDVQLYWLPIIWNMVLTRRLIANLDATLNNGTMLYWEISRD